MTPGLFFFSTPPVILFLKYETEMEATAMKEITVFDRLIEIAEPSMLNGDRENNYKAQAIAKHRAWLRSIRHERPSTEEHFRIGVYIRYYNQTKYENYLEHHKKQFIDAITLCPHWELIGFYIDEGQSAPNMESAPEWCRLIQDCFDGKIDLIITQKISNVAKKRFEITLLSRLMAAQKKPIGIYFVSEDMYTLAYYYQEDLRDSFFLPGSEVKALPDETMGGSYD